MPAMRMTSLWCSPVSGIFAIEMELKRDMKVLVIGSGGREHALIWKLSQSTVINRLYAAPGNAGIALHAECIDIQADDLDAIVKFSVASALDLVVIGPEAPLALGLADRLKAERVPVFGPTAAAARLESSKAFARKFCLRHNIPGADFEICVTAREALESAKKRSNTCVLKADGLAAGKGVFVCRTAGDVENAVAALFESGDFGSASSTVIVEDLLSGEEASIFVLVDGRSYIILESSQDHKAVFDNDQGPNTGGMGAYSPAPVVTSDVLKRIKNTIIHPAVSGMSAEGYPFTGVLYAGLMIQDGVPRLLEFNVRFGDPETQPLLFRLQSDLGALLKACASGELHRHPPIQWSPNPAVCVVMASGGYPGKYKKGFEITGLDTVESWPDTMVFHAGTNRDFEGRNITSGGRVLGVTGSGLTIKQACLTAYKAVHQIHFTNCFYRTDIAYRALARMGNGGSK
jgi:phosphoribosylamine---glycine ligase